MVHQTQMDAVISVETYLDACHVFGRREIFKEDRLLSKEGGASKKDAGIDDSTI